MQVQTGSRAQQPYDSCLANSKVVRYLRKIMPNATREREVIIEYFCLTHLHLHVKR